MWSPNGNLWHSYKNNTTSINGFLEDYALVIEAFISLYEATFDEKWLLHSKQLTDYCFDHFYDTNQSLFAFKSDEDEPLITTHFEIEDNVIPASNSIMAKNLYQLSIYFNHSYYEEISKKMTLKIIPVINYPSAFSNWLDGFLNYSKVSKELAICGREATEIAKVFHQKYTPSVILAGTTSISTLPFLKERFVDDKNVFYLCKNKSCELPTEDFDKVIKEIGR